MILHQRWLLMGLTLGAAEAAWVSLMLVQVCSNSAVGLGVWWPDSSTSSSYFDCANQVKNVGVMGPLGSHNGTMYQEVLHQDVLCFVSAWRGLSLPGQLTWALARSKTTCLSGSEPSIRLGRALSSRDCSSAPPGKSADLSGPGLTLDC